MTHLIQLTRDGCVPEVSRPDPDRVLSGDPVHTTWNLEARGATWAGVWQSTPGCWRVEYDEWEYVRILEGHSVLTDEAGCETHLRAGDSWVIRPGFSGTWTVLETTVKEYVIVE
ncbi:MAG: cupin domain-containing protein [Gemmobacter sp.]|nr:cupin domain-containing protein [Gemmobacter sp.]